MLVVVVIIVDGTDPDRAGEVALFAGEWVPEQPPADLYDGDLVVRLTPGGADLSTAACTQCNAVNRQTDSYSVAAFDFRHPVGSGW